jgi:hypothetical protein
MTSEISHSTELHGLDAVKHELEVSLKWARDNPLAFACAYLDFVEKYDVFERWISHPIDTTKKGYVAFRVSLREALS